MHNLSHQMRLSIQYLLYLQNNHMENLTLYNNIPIDYSTLVNSIGPYLSPKDKVSRMEKDKQIIRLKKGLFVFNPSATGQVLSTELIANHLYGPSYLSMESALAYHGLIPERVYAIKSATFKRSKEFNTSLGLFNYITVPSQYFPIGIKTELIGNNISFLIASPEKALCDLITTTPNLRFQSKQSLQTYLFDDMRIDLSAINQWNLSIIEECMHHSLKKTELKLLHSIIQYASTI